jgi:hypothetical protein
LKRGTKIAHSRPLANKNKHASDSRMKKTFLFAALLSIGTTLEAQTTYDWVSNDGDPNGLSASITLDMNSSSGLPGGDGTLADIVSVSLTDPYGTYPVQFLTLASSSFTWNSSDITSMNIQGSADPFGPFFLNVTLTDSLLSEQPYVYVITYSTAIGPVISDSGGFDAVSAAGGAGTIPDPANAAVLLGFALAGLGGLRRFFRSAAH